MIEVSQEGSTLSVWLARPHCLNALDDDTLNEIAEVFSGVRQRFGVKTVVLGGRGRSFSAGADRVNPPGLAGVGERARRWHGQVGYRACRAIAECDVVTIARLQGHVIGGGLALAVACDFRVAANGTRWRLPEVDLGLPMLWGTVPRLIGEIGAARARELVMFGNELDSHEARRLGLAHWTVEEPELDAYIGDLIATIEQKPEHALLLNKSLFKAYAGAAGDAAFSDGELWRLSMQSEAAQSNFSAPD